MEIASLGESYSTRDWQTVEAGTVRIAMIGLGWWTREFAIPAVAQSTFCETTVVVSGSSEKANRVAREWDSIEEAIGYDAFHDGTADDAYDAIYICTPNAFHLPFVETAANLGKDVLCEKPMEATLERAQRLQQSAEAAGITLMIAYRMQTDPAVRRAKELIQTGAIGEPAMVHGHMSQRLLDIIPDPDQWRLDPALAGPGSSVMDLGIYPINTTRFLLERDPVTAYSSMVPGSGDFAGIPDERASFILEFSDGLLGAYSASQNAQKGGHVRIIGTEGQIHLDGSFHNMERFVVRVLTDEVQTTIESPRGNQMKEEFDYFANAILGDTTVYPDGEHGLVDMHILDSVYAAAENKTPITIGQP